MTLVHCNICNIDIIVKGSLSPGKGKVPPEVEEHVKTKTHQACLSVLKDTKTPAIIFDDSTSVASNWFNSLSDRERAE